MTWMKPSLALGLAGLTAGAIVSQASAATISIETYKDNVVDYRDHPDTANYSDREGAAYPGTLDAWNRGLSYVAFDLNHLPQNAVITEAIFGAINMRFDGSQTVSVELIDVEADWVEAGEGALTWNIAAANYGARLNGQVPVVDPDVLLWRGDLLLDTTGPAWQYASSASSWSDQDLIDALNGELTDGDGLVVFTLRGPSARHNRVASREHPEHAAPTLQLTYEIIPEPASLALLGLGGGLIALRRRPA